MVLVIRASVELVSGCQFLVTGCSYSKNFFLNMAMKSDRDLEIYKESKKLVEDNWNEFPDKETGNK